MTMMQFIQVEPTDPQSIEYKLFGPDTNWSASAGDDAGEGSSEGMGGPGGDGETGEGHGGNAGIGAGMGGFGMAGRENAAGIGGMSGASSAGQSMAAAGQLGMDMANVSGLSPGFAAGVTMAARLGPAQALARATNAETVAGIAAAVSVGYAGSQFGGILGGVTGAAVGGMAGPAGAAVGGIAGRGFGSTKGSSLGYGLADATMGMGFADPAGTPGGIGTNSTSSSQADTSLGLDSALGGGAGDTNDPLGLLSSIGLGSQPMTQKQTVAKMAMQNVLNNIGNRQYGGGVHITPQSLGQSTTLGHLPSGLGQMLAQYTGGVTYGGYYNG